MVSAGGGKANFPSWDAADDVERVGEVPGWLPILEGLLAAMRIKERGEDLGVGSVDAKLGSRPKGDALD